MTKGFVFGSSTPRELSHQKARDRSSVLEALGNECSHDVRPFIRSIHSARSESCPRRSSKQYAFGSSTPRDWSHQQKVPIQHRAYDAKPPPKIRSQTIDSIRHISGSIKSIASVGRPQKAVTSRESRPKLPRPNLPPAPSTSRPAAKQGTDDDEEDALSEPDMKVNNHQEFKQWAQPKNVPEKKLEKPAKGTPVVNHVIETENELIFEKSEDFDEKEDKVTVEPTEERRELNSASAKKPDLMVAQAKEEKEKHDKVESENKKNGAVKSGATTPQQASVQ